MIAIITINYNLSKETIHCVDSLLKSTHEDFVVYLIDNGSEDSDYQKLKTANNTNTKIKLLRIEKNRGYVDGVNYGIKTALNDGADYIMIMNNDTVIDSEAVTHLVDACKRHNDRAIVTGKVYYFHNPAILQHTGVVFTDKRYLKTAYPGQGEEDNGQYDQEMERDSLDDVFWLFPAKLIDEIGYYSPYFFLYAEQGDFARRAYKAGYQLIFTPKAKLWHKESLTTGNGNVKSLKIMYWRGQGSFIFLARHLKWYYFMIWFVKQIPLTIIKSIMLKDRVIRKATKARLRGYWYGMRWLLLRNKNNGYNPY